MDPTTILYFFYAILGISVIIFIHELGHFLAAKRVGVRVEAFSVGFDPTVFGRRLRLVSFRRGETEYILGLVPFGGYVKMAGETSMDAAAADRKPDPDWLVSKSPGARAQVFAAGAVFNIVSALFFFMIAFSVGAKFTGPSVGVVEPGMPAWRAGVRPGDAIAEVDGKKITDFQELVVSVAFGDQSKSRRFRLYRNGELTDPIEIRPKWEPTRGFYTTGIAPDFDSRVPSVLSGSAAEAAGVQVGDRLVGAELDNTKLVLSKPLGGDVPEQLQIALDRERADAVAMPSSRQLFTALGRFYAHSASKPIRVLLARGDALIWLDIRVTLAAESSQERKLGVHSLPEQVVDMAQPDSDAESVLNGGDRIVTLNGKPFVSAHWFGIAARDREAQSFVLTIENAQGELRTENVARTRLLSWDLEHQIAWKNLEVRLGSLDTVPALGNAGLQQGDVVTSVGGSPIASREDLDKAMRAFLASDTPTLDFRVIRDGDRTTVVEVPRLALSKNRLPLDKTPRVLVVGPDTAAARLGIESGSRILQIGEIKTTSWEDLTKAVQGSSPAAEVAVRWRTPSGEERSATGHLSPDVYTKLGITHELKHIVVKEGPVTALFLGFERSIVTAKWVFLTLKGLIKREVSAKNLAGPIGVVHLMVRVSEWGLGTLIYWLALISINLGILNLLPFPILDGGHLLFLTIEKIKGSPVSLRIQEIATTVAFFLIISLAVFVTYNDILRIFM